jgi:hypothetical protein
MKFPHTMSSYTCELMSLHDISYFILFVALNVSFAWKGGKVCEREEKEINFKWVFKVFVCVGGIKSKAQSRTQNINYIEWERNEKNKVK